MKKTLLSVILACLLLLPLSLAACTPKLVPPLPPNDDEVNIDNEFEKTSDILIVYFSKTNTTESVALAIYDLLDADLYEIERKEPYPEEYTPTTEIAREEKDANARPELKTYLPKSVVEQYDTIFVGFPIWWSTAPMPVLTFLNFYDLSGKTIYTFCTAASSGIGGSTEDIRANAPNATVIEGRRFNRNDDAAVEEWISSLNINRLPVDPPDLEPTASLTYERNGNAYTVTGVTETSKISSFPQNTKDCRHADRKRCVRLRKAHGGYFFRLHSRFRHGHRKECLL